MFIGFIYLVTNLINGKKYVGQTFQLINARWRQHRWNARRGKTEPLYQAIRKYGVENFEVKQIANITCETKEDVVAWLNILEPLYIIAHNSLAPNGYNCDSGGKNKTKHPDSIEKHRQKLLGRKDSAETIERKRIAQTGIKRSKEGTANVRDAQRRPEVIAKHRANASGQNNPMSRTNIEARKLKGAGTPKTTEGAHQES